MDEAENHTRKNRFEKRRKNTKFISILLIVSVILLLSLIIIWIFGGGEDEEVDNSTQEQVEIVDDEMDENQQEENITEEETTNAVSEEEMDATDNDTNNEDITIEEVESSDDNVSEAYTGNWQPVGTEQEGPHTVNYDSGSQDRIEMKEAILLATGLDESDYFEWWIGNGGDQKVIATVSDTAETEVYRVYLSWIENEGWQPTTVEILIENDKKSS